MATVRKAGRPSKYESHIKPNLRLIKKLRSGDDTFSHEDIAKILGIAKSTYMLHLKEINAFSDAIKKTDEQIVEEIETSLYRLAMGTAYRKRTTKNYDAKGNLTGWQEVIDELPPDNASVFFALVNLSKGKWKHKQEIEHAYDEDALRQVESFTDKFERLMKERKHEIRTE